jgi:glycosyltransferase involved in cell wall biosynthesis
VVIAFSGIAEDTFVGLAGRPELRVLQRGSAHIAVQRRILDEEQGRSGITIETPSDWMVAREKREYAQADIIHVLSDFALKSFLDEGIESFKLFHLDLGVEVSRFCASPEIIDRRCQRILSGVPLRVLNVGTFCYRKGALDWVRAIGELPGDRFSFRFVGSIASEAKELTAQIAHRVEFIGKLPQSDLPREYEWGDIFVLPTLEDGFAVVLTQALAAGLPLITTPNCGGPDLIRSGGPGWVIPIRNSKALVDQLLWLDQHRQELAMAVRSTINSHAHFDWAETAKRAESNVCAGLKKKEGLSQRKPNGF